MLEFLWDFIDATGQSPSHQDIVDGTGCKTPSNSLRALNWRHLVGIERHRSGGINDAVVWVSFPGRNIVETEPLYNDPITGELCSREEFDEISREMMERRCLCCGARFMSRHKFNRLCSICSAEAAQSGGGEGAYGLGYVSNGQAILSGAIGGKFLDGRV